MSRQNENVWFSCCGCLMEIVFQYTGLGEDVPLYSAPAMLPREKKKAG
jgi:hypothetical protein